MQKILIADDEAKIRRIIRDFLAAKGFETVEAAGRSAAKYARPPMFRSFSSRHAAKNLTSSNALSAARTIL